MTLASDIKTDFEHLEHDDLVKQGREYIEAWFEEMYVDVDVAKPLAMMLVDRYDECWELQIREALLWTLRYMREYLEERYA